MHPAPGTIVAACVVAWLLVRAATIVRDSVVHAAREARRGCGLVAAAFDGALSGGSRLLVLAGSAVALGCAIGIARMA